MTLFTLSVEKRAAPVEDILRRVQYIFLYISPCTPTRLDFIKLIVLQYLKEHPFNAYGVQNRTQFLEIYALQTSTQNNKCQYEFSSCQNVAVVICGYLSERCDHICAQKSYLS